MIAKELILAICAYNLVRHTINWAAKRLKLPPRALSFTRTLSMLDLLSELPFSDQPLDKQHASLNRTLHDLTFLVLYKRNHPRPTQPRKVWPRGQKKFFKSSTTRQAEMHLLSHPLNHPKP